MKKIGLFMAMLMVAALLLSGCASSTASVDTAAAEDIPVDVEIREKLFIAQTNEIYVNKDNYMGKTIKYEGMYFRSYYEPTESDLYMVIRYGPGCCGDDGNVGFEVVWDNAAVNDFENGDWVEVIGDVEEYEEFGTTYVRLNLKSMRAMPERGAETVTQ